MNLRRYWLATSGSWAQIVTTGVALLLAWLLLTKVGVLPLHLAVLDVPALMFVGLGFWLLLANRRILNLSHRVAELERSLAADEAEIATLTMLPAMDRALSTPASSAPDGPIATGVRDAIAAYKLAGFTEEQAQSLAQEVLRLQVKEAGGWSA